jgi:hypothetical protein
VAGLTLSEVGTQIGAKHRKEVTMNTQVNWQRIRKEFQRLTDVENLKSEVHRIGAEIRKFDFHAVLSPSAQERVKTFEKRYGELMRTLQQAQRQMDREVNRILRQIKGHRADVTRAMSEQKDKLEKMSSEFQKRFSKSAKSAGGSRKKRAAATGRSASARRKPAARKSATRKRKS